MCGKKTRFLTLTPNFPEGISPNGEVVDGTTVRCVSDFSLLYNYYALTIYSLVKNYIITYKILSSSEQKVSEGDRNRQLEKNCLMSRECVSFFFRLRPYTKTTYEPLGVGIWWLTFCLLLKSSYRHRWAIPDNNKKYWNLFGGDVQCPRRPIRPNLIFQRKKILRKVLMCVCVGCEFKYNLFVIEFDYLRF